MAWLEVSVGVTVPIPLVFLLLDWTRIESNYLGTKRHLSQSKLTLFTPYLQLCVLKCAGLESGPNLSNCRGLPHDTLLQCGCMLLKFLCLIQHLQILKLSVRIKRSLIFELTSSSMNCTTNTRFKLQDEWRKDLNSFTSSINILESNAFNKIKLMEAVSTIA